MEVVKAVIPRDDFHLEITFSTGKPRLFDARPYLEKGEFQQLKDLQIFKQAYVDFDTVCWPGELDISPATLFIRSKTF